MDNCSCGGAGRGHMNKDTGCGRHNKQDGSFCGCGRHQQMHGFMETCLMALLTQQESHGYRLAEQLAQFGFEDVNVSTLYRVMRKMENNGWVCSSWESGCKGPQRRVYAITEQGKQALDEWVQALKARKQRIDSLLDMYQQK